jgi:hypothetical protein
MSTKQVGSRAPQIPVHPGLERRLALRTRYDTISRSEWKSVRIQELRKGKKDGTVKRTQSKEHSTSTSP